MKGMEVMYHSVNSFEFLCVTRYSGGNAVFEQISTVICMTNAFDTTASKHKLRQVHNFRIVIET